MRLRVLRSRGLCSTNNYLRILLGTTCLLRLGLGDNSLVLIRNDAKLLNLRRVVGGLLLVF